MPRTRRKGKGEPLYILTAKALGRAWGRLSGAARGFWYDLTQARGRRYFRALAIFCALCVLIGLGASAAWRTAAVRSAIVQYRAVFLGAGGGPPAESQPPLTPGGEQATAPDERLTPAGEPSVPASSGTEQPVEAGPTGEQVPPPGTGGGEGGGQAPGTAPDLRGLVRPVVGAVTMGCGWQYSTTLEDWRFHPGVDIQAPEGTAVRAALAGRVIDVSESFEYGLTVTIDHGAGHVTVYGQLEGNRVKVGDSVSRGQQIAAVGSPAGVELEDGPHLHFELWTGELSADPEDYWE